MTALPKWFLETGNYKIADNIEDMPEYHKKHYLSERDSEVREYAEEALKHGAHILYNNPKANTLDVAMVCLDNSGNEVVFTQGLYNDPRNNTFISTGKIYQGNVTGICRGIDIWSTDKLLQKSMVCGICGEEQQSFDDFGTYSFAGFACKECARKEQDSLPAGWYN